MQIEEGVFQFKIPMPANPHPHPGLKYTLVYAVQTEDGWVVIDAGLDTDEGFQAFKEQLTGAGIAPRDVTVLMTTHGHADHAGLANRIKEFTGAKLAMHKLDATGKWDPTMDAMAQEPEGVRSWLQRLGVPPEELTDDFFSRHRSDFYIHGSTWDGPAPNVDIFLEDGDEIIPDSGLRVMWTPGHSPGHLCVHDQRRRLLFSGDHILPTITSHFCLYPHGDGDPLGRYLRGQRDIRELDVILALPAHEHTIHNLRQRIDEILAHHRRRMDEVLAQVFDSPKTPWQIAMGMSWSEDLWEGLIPGTRRMALTSVKAHLEHMVANGELLRHEGGTTVLYARP